MYRGHQLLSLRLLILLTAMVGVFLLISSPSDARTPDPEPSLRRVATGDTLWEIASDLGSGGDLRAVVAEIQRLNNLNTAEIYPGQMLALPAASP